MTQAVTQTIVTPLTSAVYVASTDKILGASANYIVEFNATTGAYIRAVRAIGPMYGPMWLNLIAGMPYVATFNNRATQDTTFPSIVHARSDIFPINTATLQTGTGLGVYNHNFDSPHKSMAGPHHFVSIGTKAYFLYPCEDFVRVGYVDLLNGALWSVNTGTTGFWAEQIDTDGTYIYYCDPNTPRIARRNAALTFNSGINTAGRYPVACIHTGTNVYAVCGDNYLINTNSWTVATSIDLEADPIIIAAGITGIKPMRLRYNSADSRIYIPVQNKDGVIVFNPGTGAVTAWKSGFASPVDVVLTPTKKFAVLTSETGLQEIT